MQADVPRFDARVEGSVVASVSHSVRWASSRCSDRSTHSPTSALRISARSAARDLMVLAGGWTDDVLFRHRASAAAETAHDAPERAVAETCTDEACRLPVRSGRGRPAGGRQRGCGLLSLRP